jgi:glycerate 2-kinase
MRDESKIRNTDILTSHGNVKARRIALDVLEHAIREVDGYELVKRTCRVNGKTLIVGKRRYDLAKFDSLYVIGAGKATMSMAEAIEHVLGDKITKGIIIVKKGQRRSLNRIRVYEGGHPIPNTVGLEASKKITELAKQGSRKDIFVMLISGGSSSLMSYPINEITLEDEKKVTDLLLSSGANIVEINAVRRHLSQTNGGRLAQLILNQGARLINLVISDVVGRPLVLRPDVPVSRGPGGSPAMPDGTTFNDARRTLSHYQLWNEVPGRVRTYLRGAGPELETPKSFRGMKVDSFVLASIANGCLAARKRADSLGLNSIVLSSMIEGESREAGAFMAAVAREAAASRFPVAPPCVIVCGGETTVKMHSQKTGGGGPSQEFALGFALKIEGRPNVAVAALDTDGTDGPTEYAGGVADGYTVARAKKKGSDVFLALAEHRSSLLLQELHDAIVTGETGTNVCDLNIAFVSA